jgi:hypothetical protein
VFDFVRIARNYSAHHRPTIYTADVSLYRVELDDTEIKLLLVAIRQVEHTFTIAEAQSVAAGEPLPVDYGGVRESYQRLHRKLADLGEPDDGRKPYIVK